LAALQQGDDASSELFAREDAHSGIYPMPADQGPPPRQIDVAMPTSWHRFNPKVISLWLLVFFLLVIVLVDLEWSAVQAAWPITGLTALLVVAAWIGWLVFRNGLLTWLRLARAPARALMRGDRVGAERAFAAALARARRFSPHDYRRALMVVELAGYLKQLGRSPEAKALFEEGVEILGQQWKTRPQHYLVALNNLAVYLIDVHDFAAAQRMLEKVLDLTLFWRKGGITPHGAAPNAPLIELVLHLNLVVLFVRLEELTLAADHLEEADALFGKLLKPQRRLGDWYRGVRALLLHAQGRLTMAANELDKVKDQDNALCISVRAKLSLARGEFSQAEQLLRKFMDLRGKQGSVHRPDLREQVLDLAESLFGGSKYDEAFHALEEARAITRDFALPPTSAWHKALASWLHRAQQLGRTADVAWLEADLQGTSTAAEQAITISPRLRIRPPES
jgi:tetratricopeptide (TPR) repeat protein